jgi:O-antigen/teichoic acid export membrane protein
MAMPVLVTVLISATVNAWFYVSLTLADIVYIFPYALATTLYAAGSAQPTTLARKARLTLGLAVICCMLANCFLLFGSRQLLGLFGQSYAEQGTWCLRILGLGAFPFIIKEHYIAIYRIQDRITHALFPLMAAALLELGAAALGARLGGVSGLSLGWVTAECVEAVFMFRLVYKTARFQGT